MTLRTGMAVWLAALSVGLAGCQNQSFEWKKVPLKKTGPDKEEKVTVPPDVEGTVAQDCVLVSTGETPIGGWGVVVGLGATGSSEVPPDLKEELTKYLKGQIKIARPTFGTGDLTVAEFLADLDTAVVRVEAVVPPGAPQDTVVDVLVSAPPHTQTTSLEGGLLWPTELVWKRGATMTRGGHLRPVGRAEGAIFVNPFLDPKKPADAAGLREGRILGGARVIKDMPIRLQLRQPDYMTCNVLQKRINERFRTPVEKVAEGKTKYYLDIRVPSAYRNDYQHFLQLVMHLPVQSGPGAFDAKANRISEAMKQPDADCDGLALVWEAMGRSVLPVVQKMYSSTDPAVAYYAARTGLRLGDTHLAGPIVLRTADTNGKPHQLDALTELGRHPNLLEAADVLRARLSDRNELVRIAAYEACVRRNDFSAVKRYEIDKGLFQDDQPSFIVDLVESTGDFVIYATCTLQPRIVLFGRNISLANTIFYDSPTDGLTFFSKKALSEEEIGKLRHADPKLAEDLLRHDHVVVYRKLPRTEEISEKYRIDFRVWSLIHVLGSKPRPDEDTGKVLGLGMTYSQVVRTLAKLCKNGGIQAKFVLQALPQMQRIYRMTPAKGRPDMPNG